MLRSVQLAARHVHPDWLLARAAARDLAGPHLWHLYALHPRAQMGPAALLLALLPRPIYVVLVAGLVVVPLAAARTTRSRAGLPARLVGAVVGVSLVPAWSQLAWKGHADDALVLVGAALLLHALRTGHRGVAAGAAVLAVLAKPTGLVLLAAVPPGAPLAAALALSALGWSPFVLGELPQFLAAGRGVMAVGRGSLPGYLGHRVGSAEPVWVRPVQLLGGTVAVLWSARSRAVGHGLVLAVALRALVEVNPAPAYSVSVLVLAGLLLALEGDLLIALCAAASFWTAQPVLDGHSGLPRLLALSAVVVLAVRGVVVRSGPNGRPPAPGGSPAAQRAAAAASRR
ncbi:MAG: hypothetical protein ACTHQ3_14750 [Motilibacteraceae bacterium]